MKTPMIYIALLLATLLGSDVKAFADRGQGGWPNGVTGLVDADGEKSKASHNSSTFSQNLFTAFDFSDVGEDVDEAIGFAGRNLDLVAKQEPLSRYDFVAQLAPSSLYSIRAPPSAS